MTRRDFIALAAVVVALGPAAVRAQQPSEAPEVVGAPYPEAGLRAFRRGLRDLGYAEGKNLRLDIRSAEGDISRPAG